MLRVVQWASLSVLLAVMVFACRTVEKKESLTEGVIHFDVSFPFNNDDLLTNLFPDKMKMSFNETCMRAELSSMGVSSHYVINNEEREFNQLLEVFSDKYRMKLDQAGVNDMLDEMPRMILTPTLETDTLAGMLCKKTIAEFKSDSVPPIILWHTNEIHIDTPNWWNQFNECEEVLLGYEVEQYGMRMKLRATSIERIELKPNVFSISDDFINVDWAEMKSQIHALLRTFGRE